MSVDTFETALRRLLIGFGIEIGTGEVGDIVVDPVEPLQRVPPHLWLSAMALHMEDLRDHCMRMALDFDRVGDAITTVDSSEEDIGNVLWETLDDLRISDMRFHAFYFSIYGELIRAMLIDAGETYTCDLMGSLRPQADENRCASAVNSGQMSQRLSLFSSLSTKDLMNTCNDLLQLEIAARAVAVTLELFESSSEENSSVLGLRFANTQSVILTLAHALLCADVSARCLLSSMEKWT